MHLKYYDGLRAFSSKTTRHLSASFPHQIIYFSFFVLILRTVSLVSFQLRLPGKPHAGLLSKTLSFLFPCLEDQRWHNAAPGLLSIVLLVLASSPGFLLCVGSSRPHHSHTLCYPVPERTSSSVTHFPPPRFLYLPIFKTVVWYPVVVPLGLC